MNLRPRICSEKIERTHDTHCAVHTRKVSVRRGSLAHGITYSSKSGVNYTCYAVWLRALDDGKTLRSEPTRVVGGMRFSSRIRRIGKPPVPIT